MGGHFEGKSSYHDSYENNEGSRVRRELIKQKNNQILPEGQFQSGSTYQATHKGDPNAAPSHLIKHEGQLQVGGKFEGKSSYLDSY